MRVIVNEMKKILNWKSIVLIVIFSVIFYHLFIMFYFNYFPNGRPSLDYYNVGIEMEQNYGVSMNEREYEDFKKKFEEQKDEAKNYLQSNEDFVKAGIGSYEDILQDKFRKLRWEVLDLKEEHSTIFWQLQARENLISLYEIGFEGNKGNYEPLSSAQEERFETLENNGGDSILPYVIMDNYRSLISPITVLTLLSVMIMISPIYMKDKRDHLLLLQYTTKTGRNLFKKKVWAALLSVFIIITLQLLCFFTLYSTNDTTKFFQMNINSAFDSFVYWYDLTFLQYILLTVACIYILGVTIGLIVVCLSRLSPNYMTVIGIQVPIAFILFGVLLKYIISRLTDIEYPEFLVPLLYILLSGIGIISIILLGNKEKKVNIL